MRAGDQQVFPGKMYFERSGAFYTIHKNVMPSPTFRDLYSPMSKVTTSSSLPKFLRYRDI